MSVSKITLGQASVDVSNNRGMPVSYWSERCIERLIQISEDAPEPIKQQALEYKKRLHFLVHHYMVEAAKSYGTTVKGALKNAGHEALANGLPGPEV